MKRMEVFTKEMRLASLYTLEGALSTILPSLSQNTDSLFRRHGNGSLLWRNFDTRHACAIPASCMGGSHLHHVTPLRVTLVDNRRDLKFKFLARNLNLKIHTLCRFQKRNGTPGRYITRIRQISRDSEIASLLPPTGARSWWSRVI
jgi:hypothetical protein